MARPAGAVQSLDVDELEGGASESASTIYLISKEGRRLPAPRAALMLSELCKTTLEGDREATEIPLYHIEGPIVQKVVDYLMYHQRIPPRKIDKPLLSSAIADLVDRWDVAFIEGDPLPPVPGSKAPNGSAAAASAPSGAAAAAASGLAPAPSAAQQEVLFKLLLAANYLNIKSLLALTAAKVATLIKGKTPDQIRATFNIRSDFTEAEVEEVRKEYKDLIG